MRWHATLPVLALTGGLSAFAACGLALALLGVGLPFVAGAAISGLAAGALIYSMGRWRSASAAAPGQDRVAALERQISELRHELRGALSPALMVSDRLLRHDDPLVRKTGETVVRSIERATVLLRSGPATPRAG